MQNGVKVWCGFEFGSLDDGTGGGGVALEQNSPLSSMLAFICLYFSESQPSFWETPTPIGWSGSKVKANIVMLTSEGNRVFSFACESLRYRVTQTLLCF